MAWQMLGAGSYKGLPLSYLCISKVLLFEMLYHLFQRVLQFYILNKVIHPKLYKSIPSSLQFTIDCVHSILIYYYCYTMDLVCLLIRYSAHWAVSAVLKFSKIWINLAVTFPYFAGENKYKIRVLAVHFNSQTKTLT